MHDPVADAIPVGISRGLSRPLVAYRSTGGYRSSRMSARMLRSAFRLSRTGPTYPFWRSWTVSGIRMRSRGRLSPPTARRAWSVRAQTTRVSRGGS